MRYILLVMCFFSLSNAVEMYYDDGTAASVLIEAGSRGVWFHINDFFPYSSEVKLSSVEMWFFENSYYPWDTDQFRLEIWSGDESGPVTLLYSSTQTAIHNVPVLIDVSQENIIVNSDFWLTENTTFSVDGSPSPLMDGSPPAIPHSCGYTGWITDGDLLFRCSADEMSLEATSWGMLKVLF